MEDRVVRLTKTAIVLSGFLALGISMGIRGPTLQDLRQQVGVSVLLISYTLTVRAAGHCVGSFVTGFLYNKINFLLSSSAVFIIAAVVTLLVPLATSLTQLLVIFTIYGISFGYYDAGCNIFLLHLWGTEVSAYMQGLQFMYGAGSLIAPLIAQPFLMRNLTESTEAIEATEGNTDDGEEIFHPEDVRLIYPYGILSGIIAANGIIFSLIWKFCPKTLAHATVKRSDDAGPVNPQLKECSSLIRNRCSSCSSYTIWKGLAIFFIFLLMHNYLGIEISYGAFLSTYAFYCDLHLDPSVGAQLTTLFWLTFTLMKILTMVLVSKKLLSDFKIIFMSLLLMLVSNLLLIKLSSDSVTWLIIGITIQGIGQASIFGSIFSLMQKYFQVTSFIASGIAISCTIGEFTYPYLIGYYIKDLPQILLIVSLCTSSTMILLFLAIVSIGHFKLLK